MLASYAVILRRSALVTAPVAAAMIVLSGIVGGGKGLVGALLGVGLVIVFFGISAFAMRQAAKHSPQVMMVTAIITYLVKIVVLLFFVAKYSGTTAFNGKLFAFTVIACVIVWTTSQALVAARLNVPYVEPVPQRPKVSHAEPEPQRPKVSHAEPDGKR
jgi:ATP synthase protein I